MNDDRIHELIKNAKPRVDPATRERVRAAIEAEGVAASARPGSLMLLMRAAALMILALGAGVVAAYFNRPPEGDVSLEARVSTVRERVESLERRLARAQLQDLQQQVERLEQRRAEELESVIGQAVTSELEAREALRNERWRERHIAHVRRHYAREAEATVAAYREELELTPVQERRVRELLDAQGRKIEEVIAGVYGQRHGGRHVHDELVALSDETTEKLTALLNAEQREYLPGGEAVISADPAYWAPSDEFQDATDIDAWFNWMSISEE